MKKPMHELRNLPAYFLDQTNTRGAADGLRWGHSDRGPLICGEADTRHT